MVNPPLLISLLAFSSLTASATDYFARPTRLSQHSSTSISLYDSTRESYEPYNYGDGTVWAVYYPNKTSVVELEISSYDSASGRIAIYAEGKAIWDQSLIHFMDFRANGWDRSTLKFLGKSNTPYYIQISGNPRSKTTLYLRPTETEIPATNQYIYYNTNRNNDAANNPTYLNDYGFRSISFVGHSGGMGTGDMDPSRVGRRTQWFTWTTRQRCIVRISSPTAFFGGHPHNIHVYSGTYPDALNLVTSSEFKKLAEPRILDFPAEADQRFLICVSLPITNDAAPANSSFFFELNERAWPYGTRQLISPAYPRTEYPANSTPDRATILPREYGEVLVLGYPGDKGDYFPGKNHESMAGNTLWYRWVAPEHSTIQVTPKGNDSAGKPYRLAIHTGTSSKLTPLGYKDSNQSTPLSYTVKKGTTCYINTGTISYQQEDPVIFQFASKPFYNITAPKCKIVSPAKSNKPLKRNFNIQVSIGKDPEGVAKTQIKAAGKLIYNKAYTTSSITVKSGIRKKGQAKIEVRAQDKFGKWGAWTTRTVSVK